jgi:hypothetical protein
LIPIHLLLQKKILTLLYYQRSEKLCKNVITMFQQFQKARELKKKHWNFDRYGICNLNLMCEKLLYLPKTIATFWFFIFFSDCWQPTHCFWMLNLAKMNLKFVPVKILSIFQIRPTVPFLRFAAQIYGNENVNLCKSIYKSVSISLFLFYLRLWHTKNVSDRIIKRVRFFALKVFV